MAEANSVVEKISENILQCGICFEQLSDSRGLPCLPCQQGFCRECLEGCNEKGLDKGKLACPTCRKQVEVPCLPNAKDGVNDLPVHLIASGLSDVEKERTHATCSNCDDPAKEANFYCFDCKEYLCAICYASHKKIKALKEHKIATVEDFRSGKVVDEGRFCKVHGEIVRYYCETEKKQVCVDCVSFKTCPTDHTRSSLKDAAKKQTAVIEKLIKRSEQTKKKIRDAVKEIEQVSEDVKQSQAMAEYTADKAKRGYIDLIEDVFLKHATEIANVGKLRTKKLEDKKQQLQNHLVKLNETEAQSLMVVQSGSDFQVTSRYASLADSLKNLNRSHITADKALGYFTFQTVVPVIHFFEYLSLGKEWTFSRKFKSEFKATDVAISNYGDSAVSSITTFLIHRASVQVFLKTAQIKCTFEDSPTGEVKSFAITPDNRYIIDGDNGFVCYDCKGNQLSKVATYDMNNKPSTPNGIAVDTKGRIIAGLANNTISIHHADGTIINKFATPAVPRSLAVTAKGELVVAFGNRTLGLMDFSGRNVRVIEPPAAANVSRWNPRYVCCCHNYSEIFVGNRGVPKAIYRYTSDGEYLDILTTDVTDPRAIAVSEDGKELAVADLHGNQVKVFQRQ